MKIFLVFLLYMLTAALNQAISQEILINEVMAVNNVTITDEDGDTPDWIELYNTGNTAVNLNGYGITDDASDLYKWVFPEIEVEPNSHLLIFASGKDRTGVGLWWETIINWGDDWRYFVPQSALPDDWRTLGYDDSEWFYGPSGFGYGDDDDLTIVPVTMSVYIRKVFSLEEMPEIVGAVLHMDYDDGFVAYLNGQEIARANIGTPGIVPAYNDPAIETTEPLICYGNPPVTFGVDNSLLLPDSNVIAIEVHNINLESSDLTLIPFFSLRLETIPPNPSGSPPILQLIEPRLHTNFKISSIGDSIILTDPSGSVADNIFTDYLPVDVSKGRQPDGTAQWMYFTLATPGLPNTTPGAPGISDLVQFSIPGGFYSGMQQISLGTGNPEDSIYYTLNGDDPGVFSALYEIPLEIAETTVIRAIAFKTGFIPSPIATNTYFINSNHSVPVFSLSTNPANLFDPEIGIYHDNNIWNDWERPIHVEFFEQDDSLAFGIDAGVKLYGGWTRTLPQKSLAIFTRDIYSEDNINHQMFPDLPFDEFESFILRNSGNDWNVTMFRDGLMTGLVKEDSIEIPAFRPAVVYINGEYWGVYNLREKINEEFFERHFSVDPDSLDLLELEANPLAGDASHYNNMIEFITNNPLSDPINYEIVKTWMDVQEFISYEAAQIFYCNTDWPGNNIKYWRPRTPEGKWRWVLYDTDFGFGLVDNYTHNTLAFATDPYSTGWPNPSWSTFLLRQLLLNQSFKYDFINRYADLMSSSLRPDQMLYSVLFHKSAIQEDMPAHFTRWGSNMTDWLNNINVLNEFAIYRTDYARSHVTGYFDLSGYSEVSLDLIPDSAGMIDISTLTIDEFPWTGTYFNNIPLKLTAKPQPGFIFTGWTGEVVSDSATITVAFSGDIQLTAVFQTYQADTMVINEINYNSSSNFNPGDWVEFHNPNSSPVDLSSWVFRDEDDEHEFVFPQGTIIGGEGYLVLCADTSAFSALFPDISNFTGNMDFGLSGNGELIRLFEPLGLLVDTVHYGDSLPWPPEPDGNGPTLELINPALNNALPDSWIASPANGTPGNANSTITHDQPIQDRGIVRIEIFPNPFISETEIQLFAEAGKGIDIEVFGSTGKLVWDYKTLIPPDGRVSIIFKGNDRHGNQLLPGLYLCKVTTSDVMAVKKLLKL